MPSALPTPAVGGDRLVQGLLDGLHIEAGAVLHWRELDQTLRRPGHLLLNEHEAPELVRKPVVVIDRAIVLAIEHTGALIGVEAQIGQNWPIDLLGGTEPAAGLVGKAILEIVEAYRSQCGFSEIENFVAFRRVLSGDQVRLIIAVEMHLEGLIADLFA